MAAVDFLEIIAPGIMASIQDVGRRGFGQVGVAPSGAADSYACRVGNLLVGNLESAAAIEVTLMGFQARFLTETVFAVTGADLQPSLNGAPLPMWTALRSLGTRDIGRLPVVKRGSENILVGIVRRKDIIQAYNTAIVQRARHQSRSDRLQLGKIIDSEFLEMEIPSDAIVIGKRVSEIQLPEDCLIVSIQRGRKLYIAHGYSTLEAGDLLTVIVGEGSKAEVREILQRSS